MPTLSVRPSGSPRVYAAYWTVSKPCGV
jgi:hypothetical protein